jgi:hypothetical protein
MRMADTKIDRLIEKITELNVGATSKRILLVEGADDKQALEVLLDRVNPDWTQAWAVDVAGNKNQALAIAKKVPTWLALVDKDEWTAQQIEAAQAEFGNLHILPRFCMESYLVDPAELWLALGPQQQAKITNGDQGLAAHLLADLQSWKRHAARWQVINPLWTKLRALGFKEDILRTKNFPDDAELVATLEKWDRLIDAPDILANIKAALADIDSQSDADFLHQCLYAKNFFPEVVCPGLNQLLGQRSQAEWRKNIFTKMPLPPDLDSLWQRMALATAQT